MCLTPYIKRDTEEMFPCGKCPICLGRRVSQWAFRFNQELKRTNSAIVITLSYDTKKFDKENLSSNGYLQLSKRHIQLFFKRLRKAQSRRYETLQKIKYYAVGEYGGIKGRPHYHILLFGADIELIDAAWNKGRVYYDVTIKDEAINYCLKYMMKWSNTKYARERCNSDRQHEFAIMSHGIGDNYFTEEMFEWHHADLENRVYCNLLDGKKISMPRYYKNKIYDSYEREIISMVNQVKVKEKEVKKQENWISEFGDEWEEKKREYIINEFSKMYKNAIRSRDKVEF